MGDRLLALRAKLAQIVALKAQGNREFGQKETSSVMKACQTYGEMLSSMIQVEKEEGAEMFPLLDESERCAFESWKAVVFLNLAASNLKLEAYEGSRRCCNACILFINNPKLLLDDMGSEECDGGDIGEDCDVNEPVPETLCLIAAKALYRRSVCMWNLQKPEQKCLRGLRAALRIVPKESGLQNDLKKLESTILNKLSNEQKAKLEKNSDDSNSKAQNSKQEDVFFDAVVPFAELQGLQVNGGFCLKRKGMWNQSTTTACVYLPLNVLLDEFDGTKHCKNNQDKDKDKSASKVKDTDSSIYVPYGEYALDPKKIEIKLEKENVMISYDGFIKEHIVLEYNIIPNSQSGGSTWQLETIYDHKSVDPSLMSVFGKGELPPSHLVLHLVKKDSLEWYPGCEWWDRVFIDDEMIDTTTCKAEAGGGGEDIPQQAKDRAEREHARFTNLTKSEKEDELQGLSKMKKDMMNAVEKQKNEQDKSFEGVPVRREMIDALSSEFPNIAFSSKIGKD